MTKKSIGRRQRPLENTFPVAPVVIYQNAFETNSCANQCKISEKSFRILLGPSFKVYKLLAYPSWMKRYLSSKFYLKFNYIRFFFFFFNLNQYTLYFRFQDLQNYAL